MLVRLCLRFLCLAINKSCLLLLIVFMVIFLHNLSTQLNWTSLYFCGLLCFRCDSLSILWIPGNSYEHLQDGLETCKNQVLCRFILLLTWYNVHTQKDFTNNIHSIWNSLPQSLSCSCPFSGEKIAASSIF